MHITSKAKPWEGSQRFRARHDIGALACKEQLRLKMWSLFHPKTELIDYLSGRASTLECKNGGKERAQQYRKLEIQVLLDAHDAVKEKTEPNYFIPLMALWQLKKLKEPSGEADFKRVAAAAKDVAEHAAEYGKKYGVDEEGVVFALESFLKAAGMRERDESLPGTIELVKKAIDLTYESLALKVLFEKLDDRGIEECNRHVSLIFDDKTREEAKGRIQAKWNEYWFFDGFQPVLFKPGEPKSGRMKIEYSPS